MFHQVYPVKDNKIDENAPRVAGLFAGLGHISDDFDDPLAFE
jgi:hypothetical protein